MSFFERVLPAQGPFTLFTGTTGPDGKLTEQRHWNGIKTHADLEKEVQRLSMLPLNVFYAAGSYAGSNRRDPMAKRAFWLDLDGKDFNGTENALKALGTFVRATGLPPPSIYVNSGRGVHVYWCLSRDIPVAEWKVIALALKSKCEELEFKADPTSTADPARVLRAPGSLNRKGDTPIPCTVLADNGSAYAPEAIAGQLQAVLTKTDRQKRLAALVSNDDLATKQVVEKKTPDQVREMLGYVNLPQFASREMWITVLCAIQDWSDKSAEGFEIFHDWSASQPDYVSEEDCFERWQSFSPGGGIGIGTLIKLARDGGWGDKPVLPVAPLPENASFQEQVAAVADAILPTASPDGSIASLVQPSSASMISPLLIACYHAVRATGKPRLESGEAVRWLANEFVMIQDQEGLYFSITERAVMTKTVIDDMLTRWMPLNSNGVPTNASVIMRRYGVMHTVSSQGFFPGQPRIFYENGRTFVNLYSEPAPMLVPTAQEAQLLADLWDYTFPRSQDKAFGSYLLQFYAHVVQKPSIKITSAPLMVSKEFGTGKTTVMYDIPKALVGKDNSRLVSNKVLRSSFSDYISGAHMLHFDEVHINGKFDSDDTANSLKNLVTGSDVEIHPKGLKPYNIPNRIFITATSNYEDAITLPSNDERRWGIYYLEPIRGYSKAQRDAYFSTFHAFLRSARGPGVLRYIFSQIDITGFDPCAAPPFTESKETMVEKSQANEVQLLMEAHKNSDGPFQSEVFTCEMVSQWLHAETGKTYPGMIVRGFINRAVPSSKVVREIRNHSGGKFRIWAYANHSTWTNCQVDEIREALKNRGV